MLGGSYRDDTYIKRPMYLELRGLRKFLVHGRHGRKVKNERLHHDHELKN